MSVSVSIVDGPIADCAGAEPAAGTRVCLTFLGVVVRPTEGEKSIVGLWYEAYQPMAENTLRQLCELACGRFSLLSVDLAHSRGFVPVGGTSLRIRVSSEHRAVAFEAMAWLIDCIKRDVPIWKSADFGSEGRRMMAAVPHQALPSVELTNQAVVVAVNISAGGIPKHPVSHALLTFEGLQGDQHDHEKHRRLDRAVSVQDIELLDEIRAEGYVVSPGTMGENVTVRGLGVQRLSPGERLRFESGAILELTAVRKPCFVLDAIDPRLKEAVVGRCGFMARVIAPGELRPGQKITVAATAETIVAGPS